MTALSVISGTFLTSAPTFEDILHLCIDFKLSRILDIVTLVDGGVPNSTLQHRSTSTFSTYVYRMLISQPLLFKHMKNDERVAILFQYLLEHTHTLISLLKNNVSKSILATQINYRGAAVEDSK